MCSFSRSQRTWRHNRIRDAFAYAARQFKLQVYTNGRKDVQSSYEFSFKTDEYGVPTSKRSDLVVTDERGISYVLDVTICDSINALCVKHKAGGKAGSMPALQLLYNNHVNTYEKIGFQRSILGLSTVIFSPAAPQKTLWKTKKLTTKKHY